MSKDFFFNPILYKHPVIEPFVDFEKLYPKCYLGGKSSAKLPNIFC
jgi:hypothetical protein